MELFANYSHASAMTSIFLEVPNMFYYLKFSSDKNSKDIQFHAPQTTGKHIPKRMDSK